MGARRFIFLELRSAVSVEGSDGYITDEQKFLGSERFAKLGGERAF